MNKALQQMNVVSKEPLNAETPRQALQEELTPNALFYVRNHFEIPHIDAATWTLQVGGAVERPRSFSLEEIKALPHHQHRVVLECAGNGRVSLNPQVKGTTWGEGAVAQADFGGTSLKNLLDLVGVGDPVVEVLFTGADSGKVRTGETAAYARSLTLDLSQHPDVLLAWEMNGEALPAEHGYPLRLIVPKHYGMSSVKWLRGIDLLTEAFKGFFQADDYVYIDSQEHQDGSPVEEMRVRSLFTSHDQGVILRPGLHQLSGIAWSGQGAIKGVQLSSDGGESWLDAELDETDGPYAWARWQVELNLEDKGEHILLLRASDASGNQQPLQQYWNRGGYGNNLVQKLRLLIG